MKLIDVITNADTKTFFFTNATSSKCILKDYDGNIISDETKILDYQDAMWNILMNYIHKLKRLDVVQNEESDEEICSMINEEFVHNINGLFRELNNVINYNAISGKEWTELTFTPLTNKKDVVAQKEFLRNEAKEAFNQQEANNILKTYLNHLYEALKLYLNYYDCL